MTHQHSRLISVSQRRQLSHWRFTGDSEAGKFPRSGALDRQICCLSFEFPRGSRRICTKGWFCSKQLKQSRSNTNTSEQLNGYVQGFGRERKTRRRTFWVAMAGRKVSPMRWICKDWPAANIFSEEVVFWFLCRCRMVCVDDSA